ncbi:MAG TPA: hypothetical protein DIT64_01310 [Verrucomicrobiales bacterium]|nr:hypothetical protein [Verrucomicrobiales bacterium]
MRRLLLPLLLAAQTASAEVEVDVEAFGQGLGGWVARKGQAAEYKISDAGYRTYQPEVSPSPDGGIYVSVRIDHRRGVFASDDHASLELSFAADGTLVSAQSSLALQGRTITSELVKGGASAATNVAAPGIDHAVKVGSDLVADLSSKILREKIIEPGRVSFPAAIRHNYNLLYKAVKLKDAKPAAGEAAAKNPAATASPAGNDTAPSPSPPAAGPEIEKPAATTPAPGSTSPAAPTPPAPVPGNPAPGVPPASAAPAPAPQAGSGGAAQTAAKQIPIPEVKPWNPGQAAATPLPAQPKQEKEKSLLMEHGDEALKLARELLKSQTK